MAHDKANGTTNELCNVNGKDDDDVRHESLSIYFPFFFIKAEEYIEECPWRLSD